jgi:hypothetical protein
LSHSFLSTPAFPKKNRKGSEKERTQKEEAGKRKTSTKGK